MSGPLDAASPADVARTFGATKKRTTPLWVTANFDTGKFVAEFPEVEGTRYEHHDDRDAVRMATHALHCLARAAIERKETLAFTPTNRTPPPNTDVRTIACSF